MTQLIVHKAQVPTELALNRLDQVAVSLFPQYSRSRLQKWIEAGELTLNGKPAKPKTRVNLGAVLEINATQDQLDDRPENMDLDLVYEDEDILVLNKPAGLVVHPGAGNREGTLLNGLLAHCPELEAVPRAGIVHRLDKDTSGIMMVAKNLMSQNQLVIQLQAREVSRIYEAVVYGVGRPSGTIEAPVGRHPRMRTKMAVVASGKEAVTHYKTLGIFERFSHVQLSLETGRTHQIRVHMQHIGFPLVGDPTYGGTFRQSKNPEVDEVVKHFPRQALHARKLSFYHPATEEELQFETPLPDDMNDLLTTLKQAFADD